MSTFQFSAGLSNALAREALRQAARMTADLDLVKVTSTAASALSRGEKEPLDAIVIDAELADAEATITGLAAGKDRSKLLVVAPNPREVASRYSIRSNQVVNTSASAEHLAGAIVERLMLYRAPKAAKAAKAASPTAPSAGFKRREIVVLGCSTGGPEALQVVLGALPARFPVPIVIVQHMPPDFTKLLADRLDKSCALTVREVTGTVKAKPGEVWIAPGHRHIKLTNTTGQIELDDGPEENNCKPAVDVLFRSAASTYGRRAVGVVLTGMGDDGARGGKLLADTGAYMIAQDEATSVVWGMPGAAHRAGILDTLLPLDAIAGEISQQFRIVPIGASA